MATIAGQFLPSETVTSVQASLTTLDTLQQSIVTAARQSDVINADQGTQAAFQIVRNLRSMFGSQESINSEELLPELVAGIFTREIAPALAIAVTELQQLWEAIVAAVTTGDEGMPLVEAYVAMCGRDSSAAFRLSMGIGTLQGFVLDEVTDTVLGFF